MLIDIREVPCNHCDGTGNAEHYAPMEEGLLRTNAVNCDACEGRAVMEIRSPKGENNWGSKCHSCGGKGFNDAFDYQAEEHYTIECVSCDSSGVIAYAQPVEESHGSESSP